MKTKLSRLSNFAILAFYLTSLQLGSAKEAPSSAAANKLHDLRVVVSARALQAEGRSHWHLYLYRGDGELIRQLTTGKGYDNVNPVFSPDGKTIAFTRMPAKWKREFAAKDASVCMMDTHGRILQVEDANSTTPSWYWKTPLPEMPPPQDFHWQYPGVTADDPEGTTDTKIIGGRAYTDPTGRFELVLYNDETTREEYANDERLLGLIDNRRPDVPTTAPFSVASGLSEERSYCFRSVLKWENTPWLFRPPLLALVFWCHLNSTSGNAYFLLNPERREVHLLSPNGAAFFLLPDLPVLVVLTEERYQDTGGGQTANCEYLDIWDSDFKRHRLSPKVAVFGGASFYQSNATPHVHSLPIDLE